MNTSANIRKAAVLLRSLDPDTAALMLGQLSADEAASIRAALRELGPLDDEEQADVVAEFRRVRPMMSDSGEGAVELSLSSDATSERSELNPPSRPVQRFDFLTGASTQVVVAMLVREHAQTVAVVLSHLTAERAAAILGALPEKLQADTIERLSVLGETDPESVTVIERELAVWLATRSEDRGAIARRRESVTKILEASDAKTRRSILGKLSARGVAISEQMSASTRVDTFSRGNLASTQYQVTSARAARSAFTAETPAAQPLPSQPPTPQIRIEFDQLIHFDMTALSAVLREIDPSVLAIALVGSHEELIDRITSQMPKRTAREFRRALRRIGPTKLSDVEGAQQIVADAAARYVMQRRNPLAAVNR